MKNILSRFSKNLGVSKRYAGFTLAEVLIVLAVIGTIASITIPSLVNKIQNYECLVALKKSYSILNSGFTQMLANDGVELLNDTSVFQSLKSTIPTNLPQVVSSTNQPFLDNLHKYFKFDVATCPVGAFGGGSGPMLVMADGSIIYYVLFYKSSPKVDSDNLALIDSLGGHMRSFQGYFRIDVNGLKKPNVWGRDRFFFYISGDGKLYPMYSTDWSIFNYRDLHGTWQNNPSLCGSEGSTDMGSGDCAARIIDDGWQMNY